MTERTTKQPKHAPSAGKSCPQCGSPLHISLFDGAAFCKHAACWYRSTPGLGTERQR